ncbi:ornithine cyclodeaminase family protein [Mesorhizobium sp. CO1-1-8]|uniref:ornithine cyclodeaminase family protein n=1 Tax=Mesorhizobium sp. CO1-1-8 TaxID=2876631 RepID=UPI001CD11B42|nr:ornithine cyclodeaminase [Mesorhizobium sp. CO1-1-8]MBZ9775034.1 ornithine cyclodeaminase [Mesorhizobium sp. CO1-1-8]
MSADGMIHIDAARIREMLSYPELIEALRVSHAEYAMPQLDRRITESPSGDRFVNLTAWIPGRAIAVKMVGVFPENVKLVPPQPSVQGIVALFEGTTGRALMTCDGAEITYRKTAADSALGADYLARKDAKTLLVLGAGGLAPHMVRAHLAARPSLQNILIWNRSPERAELVAQELAGEGINATPWSSLEAALPEADIISSATMAKQPLIRGALLRPGAHVDLVGSYLPDMREADDEVLSRAAVICMDTREGYDCSGDIIQPIENRTIRFEDIKADLFELSRGTHRGRQSETDITVFKNIGGGHLDLFATLALHDKVAKRPS